MRIGLYCFSAIDYIDRITTIGEPTMSTEFLGKVAIVSGGGSGIGAETARILCGAGASVVLSDVNLQAAESVAEEITKA